MLDAYASAGSPLEARYTWDCQRNDNGDMSFFGGAKPRARYDRIFITQVHVCRVLPCLALTFVLEWTPRPAASHNVTEPHFFVFFFRSHRAICKYWKARLGW